MRVIHVIDSLNVGGAERVLITLCNALYGTAVDLAVCVLTDQQPLRIQLNRGIRFYDLRRGNKWNLKKMRDFNRWCSGYDIAHVHLRYNLRYAYLARFIFGGRYKLLLHDHYGDIEQNTDVPGRLRFFMMRAAYVGVHPKLTAWATERVGVPASNTFTLPNFINKNKAAKPVSHQVGKPVKILLVSNFREAKNHLFALDFIARLRQVIPVELYLVGQPNDLSYLRQIKERIQVLNLASSVTIDHTISDIQPVLHQYHAAIHTAFTESGPLVLMEYLAHGFPFLAFQTGEVAHQLKQYIPELFIDNYNVDEWSQRFKNLCEADLEKLGTTMINTFNTIYAPEVFVQKCLTIYTHILKD